MAAADAGDKPTRLSATPARVRAQWQMKEKQGDLETRVRENEFPAENRVCAGMCL